MAKLTVKQDGQGETPSSAIVKQAAARVVIESANGHSIALQKPGVLAQFRLVKFLGKSAENTVYVQMVLPLTYVVEIDGVPVSQPNSEREIEALITRLDEEGVAAVMQGVQENFGAQSADETRDAIKN
jgi:hypothetical protein